MWLFFLFKEIRCLYYAKPFSIFNHLFFCFSRYCNLFGLQVPSIHVRVSWCGIELITVKPIYIDPTEFENNVSLVYNVFLNKRERTALSRIQLQIGDKYWSILQIRPVFRKQTPFLQTVFLQRWNARHLCDEISQEHWAQDCQIFPIVRGTMEELVIHFSV